jgi:serine/threonine-protein kinase RsbW
MKEKIIIENQIEELNKLAASIENISEKWGLSASNAMNLNLVLEEAVSNTIFYGFNDKEKHEIEIEFTLLENKNLIIIIEDDGLAFDPTKTKMPDTELQLEDRPIGGLGIFLISNIMDNVSYERKNERNILTLEKKLDI